MCFSVEVDRNIKGPASKYKSNIDKNSFEESKTYNARSESLEERESWKKIFMKNHGILIAKSFFDWGKFDDKNKLLNFKPKNAEDLIFPVIYDQWQSNNNQVINSFAIITKNAYPEVQEAGHNRSPIIIATDHIEKWLNPEKTNKKLIYSILKNRKKIHLTHL